LILINLAAGVGVVRHSPDVRKDHRLTSHALDGEEQTARAAGCDDYVPEPYSPRQLLAKIQQCIPQ